MNATTTLDRRADALRVIADRWDDMHDRLTAGQGLTSDEATDALINLARGFAHSTLDATGTHEWMVALRDATHKLAGYEMGFVGWEDICDYAANDEHLLSLLNQDIDHALYPLLSGVSTANACRECVRTMPSPTRWERMEDGAHCGYHAEIFRRTLQKRPLAVAR